MRIDLSGQSVTVVGDDNLVISALRARLAESGASLDVISLPDILVASFPLLPREGIDVDGLLGQIEKTAEAMAAGGHGRILCIVSGLAGMPMRRYPDFSRRMATIVTTVRTLAMRFGPHVLVNALSVGAIGEPLIAGDAAMLGHASIKRPGTVDEVVDTALFFADPLNTYMTGQMLSVDGGWSAGYGRNF